MPETLALLRLSLARNQRLTTLSLALICVGGLQVLFAWACLSRMPQLSDEPVMTIAIAVFAYSLIPAAFASVLLFDYGSVSNMAFPDSGCNHWVLRMPIRSWKIALVPIALKTVWVTILWCLFATAISYPGARGVLPLLTPSLYLSSICIWMLVLSWSPFRAGWHRMVLLAVAVLVLYCGLALMIAPNLGARHGESKSTAIIVSLVISVISYAASVWFAVSRIEVARTNATGIVPERTKPGFRIFRDHVDRTRHFKTPSQALMTHDLLRSQNWRRRGLLLAVVPTIATAVLFVPVQAATVVGVLLIFGYHGGFIAAMSGDAAKDRNVILPYLAASPISDSRIAWTRSAPAIMIATLVYLSVLLVFAGWACWPENRATWLQWAEFRATEVGSTDTMQIGLRWSIAIVIGATTVVVGQIAGWFWPGMTGRTWVSVLAILVFGLIVALIIGISIRWFWPLKDWESIRQSAYEIIAWIPLVVGGFLVLKMVGVMASSWQLRRRELNSMTTISQVILIWATLVLTIAISLSLLIPDPRATLVMCIALTALAIPLTRILVLPIAVSWNRHR